MNITGGSFGVRGVAHVVGGKVLAIEGTPAGEYQREAIKSMVARTEREKKFGALGFILGAIILSLVLGFLMGPFGVLLAVVIAAAGSFYSAKRHVVDITFHDGNTLTLECSARAVDVLMALRTA